MSSLRLPESSINRPSSLLREQVADYLREAIFHLELPPGTALVEREISEATTASRATVREAVRQLESEGIVRSVRGRGIIVSGLTLREAQELYEIRAQLEGMATRLFVERASDELVDKLHAIVESLAEAVDDPLKMIELKSDFYEVLFRGAGNSELEKIAAGMRQRITLAQANSLSVPQRPHQSLRELQQLISAIARRDSEEAVRLSIAHIQEASRAVTMFREGELEGGTAQKAKATPSSTP